MKDDSRIFQSPHLHVSIDGMARMRDALGIFLVNQQTVNRWVFDQHRARFEPEVEEADAPPARTIDDARALIGRLPAGLDRDVLTLVLAGKQQSAVAAILDMSQQGVSHRLRTAIQRLRTIADMPPLPPRDQMVAELRELLSRYQIRCNPRAPEQLAYFATCGNGSATARAFGTSQSIVQRMIIRALKRLRTNTDPRATAYVARLDYMLTHARSIGGAENARRGVPRAERVSRKKV